MGIIEYWTGGRQVRLLLYLMEYCAKGEALEKINPQWFEYDEALKKNILPETKKALEMAQNKLKEILRQQK